LCFFAAASAAAAGNPKENANTLPSTLMAVFIMGEPFSS
jgi:hypothetical protein